MKKCFFGLALCVLTMSVIVVCATTKNGLMDHFFKDSKNVIGSNYKFLKKENQKIVIDDYTITLKESLCERNTQLGYLVFKVEKKGGKLVADISKNGKLQSFGYGRFSFDYEATGTFTPIAQYSGNVLYVYISFEANAEEMDSVELEKCVRIADLEEKKDDEYKQYPFKLEYSDVYRKYGSKNGQLYISPLGCRFITSHKQNKLNIRIKKAEGEIKITKDDLDGAGWTEGNHTQQYYTYAFGKLLDLSEVKDVWINDEKLPN